jgi:hypothetical protein
MSFHKQDGISKGQGSDSKFILIIEELAKSFLMDKASVEVSEEIMLNKLSFKKSNFDLIQALNKVVGIDALKMDNGNIQISLSIHKAELH